MRDVPMYLSMVYRDGNEKRTAVLSIQDRRSGMTLAEIEMSADQLLDFVSQRHLAVEGTVCDSRVIDRIGKVAENETEEISYQSPLYPTSGEDYKKPSAAMMEHAWDRVKAEQWDVFDWQRTNTGWRLRLTRWVEYDEKKHLKPSWEV